jgi:hypothetical protein
LALPTAALAPPNSRKRRARLFPTSSRPTSARSERAPGRAQGLGAQIDENARFHLIDLE